MKKESILMSVLLVAVSMIVMFSIVRLDENSRILRREIRIAATAWSGKQELTAAMQDMKTVIAIVLERGQKMSQHANASIIAYDENDAKWQEAGQHQMLPHIDMQEAIVIK